MSRVEQSDIIPKVDSAELKIHGGYYGSYNGHWGVGLRAHDKVVLTGFAPIDEVTRYKDRYHIGKLIFVVSRGFYFRVYPLYFSERKNKLALWTPKTEKPVTFDDPAEIDGQVGLIVGNHLTGLKPELPSVNVPNMLPVNFVLLEPGDAFGVPFTPLAVRLDNQPSPNQPVTIDKSGRYILKDESRRVAPRLGYAWMVDGRLMWMVFIPDWIG